MILTAATASPLAMSAPTRSSVAKAAYSLRGIIAPPGYDGLLPSALNDQGNVVGGIETKSGAQEAFMWSAATGKLRPLGFPKGNIWTTATGINDAGLISAFGYTANYATTVPYVVVVRGGHATWVTLPGATSGLPNAITWAIDDHNEVTGRICTPSGCNSYEPVMWKLRGSLKSMSTKSWHLIVNPVPKGAQNGDSYTVDDGLKGGSYIDSSNVSRPAIWDDTGKTPTISLTSAITTGAVMPQGRVFELDQVAAPKGVTAPTTLAAGVQFVNGSTAAGWQVDMSERSGDNKLRPFADMFLNQGSPAYFSTGFISGASPKMARTGAHSPGETRAGTASLSLTVVGTERQHACAGGPAPFGCAVVFRTPAPISIPSTISKKPVAVKATATALNTLVPNWHTSGWVLTAAAAINDKGQIAGSGTYHGQGDGFLATPTK
ncbi:MAG TPA: hypothetical protein VG815_03640 [Chloroflexota bacterium]|jgi:hypothetical protein|nr:hypothetical protein [Chloroflexota bacterium]